MVETRCLGSSADDGKRALEVVERRRTCNRHLLEQEVGVASTPSALLDDDASYDGARNARWGMKLVGVEPVQCAEGTCSAIEVRADDARPRSR